jgi:hypothetical protein
MAKVSLKLHPGQSEVWRARSRFKVIVAGRRWGKTHYARTAIIKKAQVPDRLIWYIAPTYPMAKDIMWPALLDAIPRDWIRKVNETRLLIVLKNGTRIVCKGADNPDSLRGVGLHFVVLDEYQDMDPQLWVTVIRPTLATTGGEATFIGTPKAFNVLHREFLRGQDPENRAKRRWMSWQFRTIDSPFIPLEEIEQARRDMDERSFRQELEASFESMGGRVYYPFDRNIHVQDLKFDPSRPLWVGQDFNRDPMSSVIMQPMENGMVHVIDEIVLRNSSTEEVVSEIERRYWRHMHRTAIFPDPAGAYSQHARGETDLDIFRERGYMRIYHRRKHPKVADRVNCVNRLLRSADGSVKLLIDRKCKHLITSLEQTIYKEESREVDKAQGLEHSGDALGYPVEYNFPLRKIRIAGVSL